MSKDDTRNSHNQPQPYVKIAAQLGHQLSIECEATGVPDVTMSWQKHFRPPKPSDISLDDLDDDGIDDKDNDYTEKEMVDSEDIKKKKMKYKLKNRREKQQRDYPISDFNQVHTIFVMTKTYRAHNLTEDIPYYQLELHPNSYFSDIQNK